MTTTHTRTDLAIPITKLQPHPNNPRTTLRDLDTLTKSVTENGVLQPLTVLPANNDDIHHIVAGHRRYAAAIQAELTELPITVWEPADLPRTAQQITELGLEPEDVAAHATKDCHGVTITVTRFGTEKVTVTDYCTKPRSCKPKTPPNPERIAANQRRVAKAARIAALEKAYATKKPTKTVAVQLAVAAYVHGRVGHDEQKLVARCLGDTIDYPQTVIDTYLNDGGDINHIAVLYAFAAAEGVLHSPNTRQAHPATDTYLKYLTNHGDWDDPEGWTAQRVEDLTDTPPF